MIVAFRNGLTFPGRLISNDLVPPHPTPPPVLRLYLFSATRHALASDPEDTVLPWRGWKGGGGGLRRTLPARA